MSNTDQTAAPADAGIPDSYLDGIQPIAVRNAERIGSRSTSKALIGEHANALVYLIREYRAQRIQLAAAREEARIEWEATRETLAHAEQDRYELSEQRDAATVRAAVLLSRLRVAYPRMHRWYGHDGPFVLCATLACVENRTVLAAATPPEQPTAEAPPHECAATRQGELVEQALRSNVFRCVGEHRADGKPRTHDDDERDVPYVSLGACGKPITIELEYDGEWNEIAYPVADGECVAPLGLNEDEYTHPIWAAHSERWRLRELWNATALAPSSGPDAGVIWLRVTERPLPPLIIPEAAGGQTSPVRFTPPEDR